MEQSRSLPQPALWVTRLNRDATLGETCVFEVAGDNLAECVAYVRHQQMQYLKPIASLSGPGKIRFFPEAPGDYVLILHYRVHSGETGLEEIPFRVWGGREYLFQPHQIRIGDISLWVPSQWEAQLMSNHEVSSLSYVLGKVKAEWVVYDIGANLGYYTVHFAKAIGNRGHVYCVEVNPMCVYFLQANLAANKLSNCTILPVAASHVEGHLLFTLNYASSGLGITQVSDFYASKVGQEISVQAVPIDELIRRYRLRPPNLIKVDVEGAESFVVAGMHRVISAYRPVLFLEIHGARAAEQTLPLLERYDYSFDLEGRVFHSADQFLRDFGDKVMQVICHPK